ncbi:MAG: hypothetical protein GY822_22470 [Deltaproteobacteria bacterium]|nr:hypothetical protein [Deltaproteobacteria bacterium]
MVSTKKEIEKDAFSDWVQSFEPIEYGVMACSDVIANDDSSTNEDSATEKIKQA